MMIISDSIDLYLTEILFNLVLMILIVTLEMIVDILKFFEEIIMLNILLIYLLVIKFYVIILIKGLIIIEGFLTSLILIDNFDL